MNVGEVVLDDQDDTQGLSVPDFQQDPSNEPTMDPSSSAYPLLSFLSVSFHVVDLCRSPETL